MDASRVSPDLSAEFADALTAASEEGRVVLREVTLGGMCNKSYEAME